jgi:hypothetical protein
LAVVTEASASASDCTAPAASFRLVTARSARDEDVTAASASLAAVTAPDATASAITADVPKWAAVTAPAANLDEVTAPCCSLYCVTAPSAMASVVTEAACRFKEATQPAASLASVTLLSCSSSVPTARSAIWSCEQCGREEGGSAAAGDGLEEGGARFDGQDEVRAGNLGMAAPDGVNRQPGKLVRRARLVDGQLLKVGIVLIWHQMFERRRLPYEIPTLQLSSRGDKRAACKQESSSGRGCASGRRAACRNQFSS